MSCHVDFLFKQNKTKQKKLICSVSFTIYIRQQQWITMPIRFTYQLNIHMINKQRNELCDRSKKKSGSISLCRISAFRKWKAVRSGIREPSVQKWLLPGPELSVRTSQDKLRTSKCIYFLLQFSTEQYQHLKHKVLSEILQFLFWLYP